MSPWQVSGGSGHWQRRQREKTSLRRWYPSHSLRGRGDTGSTLCLCAKPYCQGSRHFDTPRKLITISTLGSCGISQNRAPDGLTWHSNTIPSNEVWVKLGGDKDHGSFKMNMQVVNVAHPIPSTTHASLRYSRQEIYPFQPSHSSRPVQGAHRRASGNAVEVCGFQMHNHNSINNSTLLDLHRDWVTLLFFAGDYELLCTMYGLSGASGKNENKFEYLHIKDCRSLIPFTAELSEDKPAETKLVSFYRYCAETKH